jgi:hypothetical protein
MRRSLRRRYWWELGLAVATAALLVLTLITREWIEVLFGVDPDGGDGTLEWAIVAALAVVTVAASAAARHEWSRSSAAAT